MDGRRPRVAIAHDYLTQRGGAEQVVLSLARAFPQAPIHTTLYDPDGTFEEFRELDVRVSRLDRIGPLRRHHRAALPVLPFVAERMEVDADLVVMSSSGWAHGFRTSGRTLVYCYSPARWLYARDLYLHPRGDLVKRLGLALSGWYLRRWDRRMAAARDRYLCTSPVIRDRIDEAYGFKADILEPPMTMRADAPCTPVATLESEEPFYLCVARLLPYKHVDAVIEAFRDTGRRLVVVGRGPDEARLRRRAMGMDVHFLADLDAAEMAWLYRSCRALVAAGHEDFGLTPLEAAVWGKPTVALRWGGYLCTVSEGVTGVFFDAPEAAAIRAAVQRLETATFDPDVIAAHASAFGEDRFIAAIQGIAEDLLDEREP